MTEDTARRRKLVVVWRHEVGGLSSRIMRVLEQSCGLDPVGGIDPPRFFSLDSVSVSDDIVQFPVTMFYACRGTDLVILESDVPTRNHYEFLTGVFDFAVHRSGVTEVHTLDAVVSAISHTSPRRVFGIVNQSELKDPLTACGVQTGMDYQTPPGGGTSISNFLLWVARTRNVGGSTLWVEVPFYLAPTRDPTAAKQLLDVVQCLFGIQLDLQAVELERRQVNKGIHGLRGENSEVARCIELLERGIMLSEQEGEALARDVTAVLRRQY